MKNKFKELAYEFQRELNDQYEVVGYFNTVIVVINDEDDKDELQNNLSKQIEEVNNGRFNGYKLIAMYEDEFPDNYSPVRAILKYFTETYDNIEISRNKNHITIKILENKINSSKILTETKYELYTLVLTKIYTNFPHRKVDIDVTIIDGIDTISYTINKENNSINLYQYKGISNFGSTIIYKLLHYNDNEFHTLDSKEFTTSNSALINALEILKKQKHIETSELTKDKSSFEVKLLR